MKTLLTLLLLALTACHTQTATPSSTAAAVASTIPAPIDPASIPILYNNYFSLTPLTLALRDEILSIQNLAQPADRRIWFIYVDQHLVLDGRAHYTAYVYYTPDRETPGIREGRCMGMSDYTVRIRKALASPDPPPQLRDLFKGKSLVPSLGTYTQVPPSPADTRSAPDMANLPFDRPDGVSDEEMVEIVSLARKTYVSEATAGKVGRILSIERRDDGFRVDIGGRGDMLAGDWLRIFMRKVGGRYSVVETSNLIS